MAKRPNLDSNLGMMDMSGVLVVRFQPGAKRRLVRLRAMDGRF